MPTTSSPAARLRHVRTWPSRAPIATLTVGVIIAVTFVLVAAGLPADGPPVTPARLGEPASERDAGATGVAGGKIPGGSVRSHRVDVPGLANLNPDLLDAVRQAENDAADDGIDVQITSGWRSRRYQQGLLDRAVTTYGSLEGALRFVARPDDSRHVTGDAVDIGPTDAAYWMSEHGSDYGLCQVLSNEIWHYEMLVEPGGTCPSPR